MVYCEKDLQTNIKIFLKFQFVHGLILYMVYFFFTHIQSSFMFENSSDSGEF